MRPILLALVVTACGLPDPEHSAQQAAALAAEQARCSGSVDPASCTAAGCAWQRGDGEAAASCHATEAAKPAGGGDTGTKTGGDTGTKTGGDTGRGSGG